MRPLPKSPDIASPAGKPVGTRSITASVLLAACVSPFVATFPLDAEGAGKGSKLPVTVIDKARSGSTARQDRLDLNKQDRQTQPDLPAAPEPVDPEDPEDFDPLDLLVPSDPHVEQAPAIVDEKPRKKVRRKKRAREPAGVSRAISISKVKGKLKLNRFHTLKLDMDHDTCRKFPSVFLKDYELPRGTIETLADNMVIVQKRICASNGSIMVTCYQNETTLSMRRSRPNDGCSK